jgi:Family of unknown function (DUF6178)
MVQKQENNMGKLKIPENISLQLEKAKKTGDINYLLNIDNLKDFFPLIPSHDLYVIIKKHGLNDSLELLHLASAQQIQAFIDFDCWNKDNLVFSNTLDWIQAIRVVGYEKYGEIFEKLDQEVPALFISRSCFVYNLEDGEAPDWGDFPYWISPDTFFEIRPKTGDDDDIWRGIIAMMDYLYRYDLSFAQKTLMDALWDIPLQMEERAYKWMKGRIMDQGFWDYLDALGIYKFIDPNSVKITDRDYAKIKIPENQMIPKLETGIPEKGVFKTALEQLDSDKVDQVKISISVLINRMAAADRVSFESKDELENVGKLAFSCIDIGIEFIAKKDQSLYVKIVESISISRLFSVGYSLLLQLKGLAQTLSRSGSISLSPRTYTLLEGPWRSFYKSLVLGHPLYSQELSGIKGEKQFSNVEEVAYAGNIVEDLSILKSIIFTVLRVNPTLLTTEGLKGCSKTQPGEITFGDLFRTSFLFYLEKNRFGKEPLEGDPQPVWDKIRENLDRNQIIQKISEGFQKKIDFKELKIPRIQRIIETHLNPLFENKDIRGLIIYKK